MIKCLFIRLCSLLLSCVIVCTFNGQVKGQDETYSTLGRTLLAAAAAGGADGGGVGGAAAAAGPDAFGARIVMLAGPAGHVNRHDRRAIVREQDTQAGLVRTLGAAIAAKKPILENGLSEADVNSWQYSKISPHPRYPHGNAFVAVLTPDPVNDQLTVALHVRERSYSAWGFPGGRVDKEGESLAQGAWRETMEEAFKDPNNPNMTVVQRQARAPASFPFLPHHLTLVHASTYTVKGTPTIACLYAVVVPDAGVLTGPDGRHEDEMRPLQRLGMLLANNPTRHIFTSWKLKALANGAIHSELTSGIPIVDQYPLSVTGKSLVKLYQWLM